MSSRAGPTRRGGSVACLLAAVVTLTAVPAVASPDGPPAPTLVGPPPAGWPSAPDVAAPIHLVVEASTGQVLAAEDAERRGPVASTVKMLTAITALDRLDPDEVIEVGPEVVGLEGASVDLEPGERWTVEQLLVGLLVRSGNDAAEALAVAAAGDRDAFAAAMREDARAIGLPTEGTDLRITSPSGLDGDEQLSATDLATIARVLLAQPELRAIVALEEATLPGIGTDVNRNLLLGTYPGATGVKTGYTEAAGNSLVASAERGGRELVVVVLGGGPDPERFEDARRLLDHGFGAFTLHELAAARTLLVAGGRQQIEAAPTPVSVPAEAAVELRVPLPTWAPDPGELPAPVVVDGVEVGAGVATIGAREVVAVEGPATLGRAAVDGIYAALRAADADRPTP